MRAMKFETAQWFHFLSAFCVFAVFLLVWTVVICLQKSLIVVVGGGGEGIKGRGVLELKPLI